MSNYFLDNFRYAIFDLDGTLVNSMPAYQDVFAAMLEPFGIDETMSRDYYRDSAGTPLAEQFEKMLATGILEKDPVIIARLVDEFFNQVESMDFEPFPGVKNMLHSLKQRGKSMFVTTGTRKPQSRLERLGFDYFFVRAIGEDEAPKGPEHFHVFADCLGINVPELCANAFLVGDGPSDMRLARQMRLGYTIGVTNTVGADRLMEAGADETVEDIRELMALA